MPPVARQATQPRPHFGGLDGLRAIAVLLVLIYHLFPGILPGGFLGVDVFFVISGFLITSLLLHEYQVNGKIRLGMFWRRRARRLLPALGLVLLVSIALGLAIGGDVLVGIGAQLAGATFFMNNWVYIVTGADYFARDNPELFRNTWSLSIEEQFYLLLPLLLIALLAVTRSRLTLTLVAVVLGTASAAQMWHLSLTHADPTRIYFGSDTHVFGLLLGVALASLVSRPNYGDFATVSRGDAPVPHSAKPAPQWWYTTVAVASLLVLAWLALLLQEGSAQSFEGGFQLATLAALALVWAVTRPGATIGRALDTAPMRWIGQRSYGIYLWHWPLLVLVSAAAAPTRGTLWHTWGVGAVTLVATVALATLSYRYVEQPIRKLGLMRSCTLLLHPRRLNTPRKRYVAAALGVLMITCVPATAYAVATAPAQSSAADAIARGQAALDRSDAESAESDEDSTSTLSDNASANSSGGDASTPPPVVSPEGRDISAVGDSVMLASLPELESAFPGINVDASVSRGFGAGVQLYGVQAQSGELRRVLLVGLGTNGPVQRADLDALKQTAGDRPIVLINAHGERDWIPGVNTELAEYAAAHTGVVLADWDQAVSSKPEVLAGDGIHPHASGGEVYADAVQQAIDELEDPSEAVGYDTPRR
ncbi:MAG: acyltransferase family protein [Leucobacter sp.]